MDDNIGSRVKEIRQELNLSMEKFGAPIGVSRSSINNIEKGLHHPSEIVI